MNYLIKDVQNFPRGEVVDAMIDGIIDLLEMACDDGIGWLSTTDIMDYLDVDSGSHIHDVLRVMYRCGVIDAAVGTDPSTGNQVYLWQSVFTL